MTHLTELERYMDLALEQAHLAAAEGEVPVGAVVVFEGEVISRAHNRTLAHNDPTAHAEILALRQAAGQLGNHRLNGSRLFVTLEPCVMCAGAMLHARIDTLVYGAADERWGAAGSVANVLQSPLLNHRCEIVAGVKTEEARQLLQAFFEDRRA